MPFTLAQTEQILKQHVSADALELTRNIMSKYDESHDWNHVLRVTSNALEIFQDEKNRMEDEIVEENYLIMLHVALLHDLTDHKYTAPGSDNHAILERILKGMPVDGMGRAVKDIIAAISYSREVREGLDYIEQIESEWNLAQIRHIVSDADKIDAIGAIGIRRCGLYSVNKMLSSSQAASVDEDPSVPAAIEEHIVEHSHEKLLKLRDEFIRTNKGKEIALKHHQYLVDWVKKCEGKTLAAEDKIWHPTNFCIKEFEVVRRM